MRSSSGCGAGRRARIIGGHCVAGARTRWTSAAFLIDRDQRGRAVGRRAMQLAVERGERIEIADLAGRRPRP